MGKGGLGGQARGWDTDQRRVRRARKVFSSCAGASGEDEMSCAAQFSLPGCISVPPNGHTPRPTRCLTPSGEWVFVCMCPRNDQVSIDWTRVGLIWGGVGGSQILGGLEQLRGLAS